MSKALAVPPVTSDDPLLSRNQAAEYLKLKPNTLARMAWAKRGPAYIEMSSRCVKYRRSALEAWLAARTVTPTGEPTA
jgi:predicted DNA-binding transcriptional regulator AlpA